MPERKLLEPDYSADYIVAFEPEDLFEKNLLDKITFGEEAALERIGVRATHETIAVG